jgi:hypothetical protein
VTRDVSTVMLWAQPLQASGAEAKEVQMDPTVFLAWTVSILLLLAAAAQILRSYSIR